MSPEKYCQEKAAPAGSNLYYASLFHTALQKRKLHALFALQQELIDTVRECQDPGVARIKLNWWNEELTRLFALQARHPVSRELQLLLPELGVEQEKLFHLVSMVEQEISPQQAKSLQHMIDHFSQGRGSMWPLPVPAGDREDRQINRIITGIAGLYNSLDYFQAAREQLKRGYCPYPRSEMENHGLQYDSLSGEFDSRALAALQNELITTIQQALADNARALQATNCSSFLFALVLARIAEAQCRKLNKPSSPAPLEIMAMTPLRKLWVAWRSKRLMFKNP